MSKRKVIVVCIAAVVLSLIGLIYGNSLKLALYCEGLDTKNIHYIERYSEDHSGKAYSVLQTTTKKGDIALVRIEKNDMGLWSVMDKNITYMNDPYRWVSIGWMVRAGSKRFDLTGDLNPQWEWHFVYYGTNAVENIEILSTQIPGNITVNIQQRGNQYWIHIISFANSGVLNEFDIMRLLEENGCVLK